MKELLLDHSIVGQSLTSLSIRKDKPYAGCRICGAVFQSSLVHRLAPVVADVQRETIEWRQRHARTHSEREHRQFVRSGRTFSPEAAHRLAPFGLVPLSGALFDAEITHALLTAPRAPFDDAEGTVRGLIAINHL